MRYASRAGYALCLMCILLEIEQEVFAVSHKFLSDEWFSHVDTLTKNAGELSPPEAIDGLSLNLKVESDGNTVEMSMVSGIFKKGIQDDAPVTMALPEELARRIFVENDMSAGMQGFMNGQIQVEGDMSLLMSLQTVQPSEQQVELLKQIQEATA